MTLFIKAGLNQKSPSPWRVRWPGSIPGGVSDFNLYHDLGGLSFAVFCPLLLLAEALTLCWPHIQRSPPLSYCLVSWSMVCGSPHRHLTDRYLDCKSLGYVAVAWSIRVPAFQPGGPGSIPVGVRNLNSYPGIGCVSFVFCPVLSSAEALTLCWLYIQGGPPLCICLVFWSVDNCSPTGIRPTGIWVVSPRLGEGKYMKKERKSLGVKVVYWRRVKEKEGENCRNSLKVGIIKQFTDTNFLHEFRQMNSPMLKLSTEVCSLKVTITLSLCLNIL